jgi:hypothetical protein
MKKVLSICLFVIAVAYSAAAQPPPPPPPNGSIPLDLVVSVLILAGVFFGSKKLRERKKQALS